MTKTNRSTMTLLAEPPIEELQTAVQRRLGSRVRGLQLRVDGSGVVLQGRAATYYAKQLAQHAIMELSSWRIQANAIEVP